ncbi:MAG: hypothetical protein L0H53_17085 [Candidatus Nitrosocosmicus sp.]|nr:hypothetical protein [Candidatus Nitrosocosmicus sp.]MDN5869074.1 hypothetical protein [Candidatus Nitrosocosmicus sp.]
MEERQFLHRLCAIALQVDISIGFAGIVDSDGKLLVGKSRDMRCNFPNHKRCKITASVRRSNDHPRPIFKDKSLSTNNIKKIMSLQSSLIDNPTFFRLIHLNDNVFLAYITINEMNDRFLYIYFRTNFYLENVLLKLDSEFI